MSSLASARCQINYPADDRSIALYAASSDLKWKSRLVLTIPLRTVRSQPTDSGLAASLGKLSG